MSENANSFINIAYKNVHGKSAIPFIKHYKRAVEKKSGPTS